MGLCLDRARLVLRLRGRERQCDQPQEQHQELRIAEVVLEQAGNDGGDHDGQSAGREGARPSTPARGVVSLVEPRRAATGLLLALDGLRRDGEIFADGRQLFSGSSLVPLAVLLETRETRRTIQARHRPIVIITSNNEKELPDAFLRRCFFHYIRFPDHETMHRIVDVHFPGLKHELLAEALTVFFEIRQVPGLKKKPSTSELLDWIKLLLVEEISPEVLRTRDPAKLIPPLHGALLKNEEDVHLFERLAFLHRRERAGS